ncbi:WD40 repeat-like protein [Anaeromyces robustus]|uniref:WD40 repeat-like protein n=1 Tax=Anaeromyces robustus TaxID=1754192 RepID=A0A1Y1WSI2_9FUNG|nr:WD40 repeat-like protein [Anaeromyces robustus]|eukprot:ORX76493.1 WD40 repeat-like protein [Anaeromyces robustus]
MKAQINTELIHEGCINDLCYSLKGKSIITVGDDLKIKIKNLKNENESKILNHHMKKVTTIDMFERIFVTGSEDGTVMLFEYPSGTCRKILTRFTLPVRCVSFSPDGKRVAIASDELKIRIINILDISNSILTIENFENKIKAVQFDPTGKFIISVDALGLIKIWDISNSEPTLVDNIPKIMGLVSRKNNEKCNIAWNSNKKHFAIPGNNNDILVFSGKDWSLLYKFESNLNKPITSIAWSANSWYMAASDNESNILIWRTQDKKLLVKYHHTFQPIKLAWSPRDNDIAFVDESGNLNIWSGAKQYLDSLNNNSTFPVNINEDENDSENVSENIIKDDKNNMKELFNLFEDIEAEEDLNVKENPTNNDDVQMVNSKEKQSHTSTNINDEEEIIVNEDSYDSEDEDIDDFVEDDDGAGYSERGYDAPISMKKIRTRHRRKEVRFENDEYKASYPIIDPQEAFQPGSTPLLTSSGGSSNKKYLAFNMLGSVSSVRHDEEISTIHVEYHDRSVLRPYSFTDHRNYSMASLSEHGTVFACEGNVENNIRSTLYFKPVETWATKSDWSLELNDNENIQVVALTNKGIVAATDKKYIRFFTFSGFQKQIISVKGKVVSMSGSSTSNQIIIVYHNGNVFNGDQCLEYMYYDADKFKVIKKDELPISQNSTLKWIGFTEYGIPATYDSEGVGRILVKHLDYQWIPVIDTSYLNKNKESDTIANQFNEITYWAVGMTEKHLLCVILKGSDHYLQFQKPIVSEINLQTPLLQLETQDGMLEEKIYRTKLFMNIKKEQNDDIIDDDVEDSKYAKEDLEIDKLLLTLIMNACKEGNIQRAFDLTSSLRLVASVEKAVLIAVRYHLSSLAERIQLIQEAKYAKQKERELNKNKKKKINNYKNSEEHSDEEPGSPELLETTEDFETNNNKEMDYIKKGNNINNNITKKETNIKKNINKETTGKKIFNQQYKSTGEIKRNPFAVEIKSPKPQHTSKNLLDAIEQVKNEHINKVKKRKSLLNHGSSSEDSLAPEKRVKTSVNSSIVGFFGVDSSKKSSKNKSMKSNSIDIDEASTSGITYNEPEDDNKSEDNENKFINENIEVKNSKEKSLSTIKKEKHALLEKFKFKEKNTTN